MTSYMAITNNAVFIDTNVLLYAFSEHSPFCAKARSRLDALYETGSELWISAQVVREFCSAITRKDWHPQPVGHRVLEQYANQLLTDFCLAYDNEQVARELIRLIAEFELSGKRIYDANLVATMLVCGIPAILTNDVEHFRTYEPRISILPFEN